MFAGLVVAIALQLTLTLLGAAIGFSAWQPGESARAVGVGAAIWAIVSVLLSLFVGGRTTGWLAGFLTRTDGILHGILLWAMSTIVAVWLLASGVSALAGGATGLVGDVLGVGAQAAGQVAGGAASSRSGRAAAEDLGESAESLMQANRDRAERLADTVGARAASMGREAEGSADTGAWLALLALGLSLAAAVGGTVTTARR
ncbi:MAG: hypothetical protein M3Q93_13550 [Gemmatimonadota bacterium]|nr:hypothetical protein [Gemmatimonadota bacterium]